MHSLLVACCLSAATSAAAASGTPSSAIEYIPAAYALPGGFVHRPSTARQLSTLLSGGSLNGRALRRGDVIELAAGVTYTGNFTFPDLGAGADWTYVVSSTVASLPPPGTRISNADIPKMATIKSAPGGLAAGVALSADHYRFVGIRFLSGQATGQTQYGIFATGYNGSKTTAAARHESEFPRDIVVDRCIIRGRGGKERDNWGISMNAVGMAVLDSLVDQIQDDTTADANAIVTWMGGSKYLVQNTAISASGENFLAGGTPTLFGVAPSDFVFRRNYLYKPLAWNDQEPSYDGWMRAVKNLFELKNATRVLVEGCVFEKSWANRRSGGQSGLAIAITPRNGGRDEHGTVEVSDVEIRNNVFANVETVCRFLNTDSIYRSQPLKRLSFHDNLAYDIGPWTGGENANLGLLFSFVGYKGFGSGADQQASDVRITHNTMVAGANGHLNRYFTILHEGDYGMFSATLFRDNIFEGSLGAWAVSGTNGPTPLVTLKTGWHSDATFDHNAIFGEGVDGPYPSGNWTGTATTKASLGFLDYTRREFALDPHSQYAAGKSRRASDGKDLGADIAVVRRWTSGVEK